MDELVAVFSGTITLRRPSDPDTAAEQDPPTINEAEERIEKALYDAFGFHVNAELTRTDR